MPLLPPATVISKFKERWNGQDSAPAFVAVERSGVMLNEKMTSAERATLVGLVQVTLRTEESARLRYLKEAEVMGVLSQNTHCYKEVLVTTPGQRSQKSIGNARPYISETKPIVNHPLPDGQHQRGG
jgi:hypothetical protein